MSSESEGQRRVNAVDGLPVCYLEMVFNLSFLTKTHG